MLCQGVQLFGTKVVGRIVFSLIILTIDILIALCSRCSAFNDTQKPMIELAKCIDPNLTHYHQDSVLQVYRIHFIFFLRFFDIDALLHVFPLLVISYFSFGLE